MSGTTPDLPTTPEPAVAEQELPDPGAVVDEVAPVEAPAEDLGLFAPTWYVLLCAVPFAAAFLVPMILIYNGQHAVPPISAAAAAWMGVGAGWLLWALGTVFWLLGKLVLSTPRSRAPHAWAWWDRTTRAWVLVVAVWGIVASLAVVVVAIAIDRLAA